MIKIRVYMDDGRVFEYETADGASAREHMDAIISGGYRHTPLAEPDLLEWYPPHRIVKVKAIGGGVGESSYQDRVKTT